MCPQLSTSSEYYFVTYSRRSSIKMVNEEKVRANQKKKNERFTWTGKLKFCLIFLPMCLHVADSNWSGNARLLMEKGILVMCLGQLEIGSIRHLLRASSCQATRTVPKT